MLAPTTSFLCCLPLVTGVRIMLWLHLLQCIFCSGMTVTNLLMAGPTYGYATSAASQISAAAWSLIGIPIILAALWGAYHRAEGHIRFYLYYGIVSFLIDLAYVVNLFIIRDTCVHLDSTAVPQGDAAFACAVSQTLSIGTLAALTGSSLYIIYAVWSYCEDLRHGGSAAAIAALLRSTGRKALIVDHLQHNQPGYNSLG